MLLPRTTGETVASDLDWFFRRDGSTFPVSYVSVPLEMRDGRGAVVAFTDIEDRLSAERVLRKHDATLAAQQASLQRVATLVAGGAASADVFATVAEEVGHVIGLPAGRGVALRARRDGDRARRLERSSRIRSRPARAGRSTGRPSPRGSGRPAARRGSTTSPTSPARSPRSPAKPGSAPARAPRSSSTARSGVRCRPTRPTPRRCRTTSRIGSSSSPSCSPRRSRPPPGRTSSPSVRTSRPRCGASRRLSLAASPRPSSSQRSSARSPSTWT